MKILERYDQTKEVQAWGETWTVPVWCMWLVIEESGLVSAFDSKPAFFGYWSPPGDHWKVSIADVRGFTNWRESLVYVGEQ